MSVKVSSQVWEHSRHSGGDLLVMLALAEYANDYGECWPSTSAVAERCRLTPRHVKRVIDRLCDSGELRLIHRGGKGPKDTTRYRIEITDKGDTDATLNHVEKGDAHVTHKSAKGDICDMLRVTPTSVKGDAHVTRTVRTSTEPSLVGDSDFSLELGDDEAGENLLWEIVKILRPQCAANRPKNEQQAFAQLNPKPHREQVALVAKFYALPKSESYGPTWHRKQAPLQLIRDWPNQVELADQHSRDKAKSQSRSLGELYGVIDQ